MKLLSVHQIVRADAKGRHETVQPNTEFSCPREEAEDYLRLGAATVISEDDEAEAPAKKKPAKAAKADTSKPEPTTAGDETQPGAAGDETQPGAAGDSMLD